MIKHIVMLKMNPEHKNMQDELVSDLNALKDKISEVRELEVGVHYAPTDKTMDIVLITAFDNIDDLQTYREHPEHKPVVDKIIKYCGERGVIDYQY
jgi:hypothetical protein